MSSLASELITLSLWGIAHAGCGAPKSALKAEVQNISDAAVAMYLEVDTV